MELTHIKIPELFSFLNKVNKIHLTRKPCSLNTIKLTNTSIIFTFVKVVTCNNFVEL